MNNSIILIFWDFRLVVVFIIQSLPFGGWPLSPSILVPCSSLPPPLFWFPERQISLILSWEKTTTWGPFVVVFLLVVVDVALLVVDLLRLLLVFVLFVVSSCVAEPFCYD